MKMKWLFSSLMLFALVLALAAPASAGWLSGLSLWQADNRYVKQSGGTMTSNLNLDPGTGNIGIEHGATGGASSPFIDFHSGSTATDYDSRIIASGGNGTAGNGAIEIQAAAGVSVNGQAVKGYIDGSTSYDFPSIAPGSSATTFISGIVADSGDFCVVSHESATWNMNVVLHCNVATTDIVQIFATNAGGSAFDPEPDNYHVRVFNR